ncbi:MAG: hypothetical protein HOM68_17555 [Gemmatimonadetes bacterium]|jgi:hypothetical protein|nr:hypothetical protein [Gemmatimonadota bacterium]MBT5590727.1 hypothetical protein [Gemmatimonadota bacterium]MBT5965138.1 hypothetical protein [Gemmatimonadota bacterium]
MLPPQRLSIRLIGCSFLAATCIVTLLASAAPTQAISQSTLAVPLDGIRLDGDLSDWPRGMSMQPIVNNFEVYGRTDLAGRDLTDSQDLTPVMMVGYQPDVDLLYLAVEVRDDVNYNPQRPNHLQSDGLEIYVSGLVGNSPGQQPTKYVMVPGDHQMVSYQGNPAMRNGAIGRTRTRAVWRRQGDITTYEWQIDLFDRPGQRSNLTAGDVIGLDVVIVDHDGPGTGNAAWVPWGPPVGTKWASNDRVGRVLLGGGPMFAAGTSLKPRDLVLSAWTASGSHRTHAETTPEAHTGHVGHTGDVVIHENHADDLDVAVNGIGSLVAGILEGVQDATDDERVLEWMRQEGASEADLSEMRQGLQQAQQELQLAQAELQEGINEARFGQQQTIEQQIRSASESQVQVRVAEAIAMAIGAEAIAAAEGSVIEMEAIPSIPSYPIPVIPDINVGSRAEHVSEIVFSTLMGLALLVGAIGITITVLRRTGGESGKQVSGMTDRIERIEQRLTDTQDVMIALSEKLDRLDEKPSQGV